MPASARPNLDKLKKVLNVLRAYVVTFGQPADALDLRAVVGAVVANLDDVTVNNRRLEGFIDQVLTAFESLGQDASLVDVSDQLLAEQVSVWLREQEITVTSVLSAYLQRFAPADASWQRADIISLVQTVIAALNDGSLSRSGGRSLVRQVVDRFDLEQLVSRWVAPQWIALAQRIASYLEKGELETEVSAIAWSYIRQYRAILSPQLIEQILTRGPMTITPAELLAGNLGEFSDVLFYKFQLLEADPVVMKSHVEIATQVHDAIEAYRTTQPSEVDVTEGVPAGELEISSPFFDA